MSASLFPDWVQVGASFRLYGKRLHVRSFVDDRVVLRFWMPHKQRWAYVVECEIWFWVNRNDIRRGRQK